MLYYKITGENENIKKGFSYTAAHPDARFNNGISISNSRIGLGTITYDTSAISSYALDALSKATEVGLLKGNTAMTLNPKAPLPVQRLHQSL